MEFNDRITTAETFKSLVDFIREMGHAAVQVVRGGEDGS